MMRDPTENPAVDNAVRSIIEAFARGDLDSAKSRIKPALGKDPSRIETLQSFIAPTGDPETDGEMLYENSRFRYTERERIEFLQQLEVDSMNLLKIRFKDKDCFTPGSGSIRSGKMWFIHESRGFIRLLICIAKIAEVLGDWGLAYEYDRRVLLYNNGDNTGTRWNFNLLQTKLGKDVEAYNFARHLSELGHDWERVMKPLEGNDYPNLVLNRFKKEDIDPNDPTIHPGFKDGATAATYFTGALALFKLLGPCPKAEAWIRVGHKVNKHTLLLLTHPKSRYYPKKSIDTTRRFGSFIEANDYVIMSKGQFLIPEILHSLQELAKSAGRECDGPKCTKVEGYLGEWKRCMGCLEAYYCSVSCQKAHWVLKGYTKGHRDMCEEMQVTLKNAGFANRRRKRRNLDLS